MANGIFMTACGTASKNTGQGTCPIKWTEIKFAFLTRENYKIPLTQFLGDSFAETLEAGIIAGDIIPLPPLRQMADGTGDTLSQEKSGQLEFTGDPESRGTYEVVNTFGCLSIKLTDYNHYKGRIFLADANDNMMFRTDGVNAMGLRLNEIYFNIPSPHVAHGETAMQSVTFTINPSEFKNGLSIVPYKYQLSDVKGIIDTLAIVTAFTYDTTTGTIKVKVVESCNQNVGVRGLLTTNFKVVQAGLTISATTADESTTEDGVYTIVATMDNASFDLKIVPVSGNLYEGSASHTVVIGS
jgi:hypothetical protein